MRILKEVKLDDMLFIDIETVQEVEKLKEGTSLYEAWDYKIRNSRDSKNLDDKMSLQESYEKTGALFAEVSKIVSIVIGKLVDDNKKTKLILKAYSSHNEKELLSEFTTDLVKITASNKGTRLVGHAIKGFDIPYIMRRCLANSIPLPSLIDIAHLKPWELTALDTLELWKGSGFSGSSLIMITHALGLASPKDDMEGEDTYKVYYGDKENGLAVIEKYCCKDVAAVCNVVLKCRYNEPVEFEMSTKISTPKVGDVQAIYNANDSKATKRVAAVIDTYSDSKKKIANEILKAATSGK